jgi:hypothetical protein
VKNFPRGSLSHPDDQIQKRSETFSSTTRSAEMPESSHHSVMTTTRLSGNDAIEENVHASLVV